MIQNITGELFERDLTKLKDEISLYNPEARLWVTKNEIKNSAGNLCLHITGGLLYLIGNVLGQTGYTRDRDAEFLEKDIPQKDLLVRIDNTKSIVVPILKSLDEAALKSKYPLNIFKNEMSTEYFLIHFYGHLNYHLGQINYHRRLID